MNSVVVVRDMIMRALIAGAVVAVACTPAYGATASIEERKEISRSISADLHYIDTGKSNPFGTEAVEIGATVRVGDYYALADWQSADKKRHGQLYVTTKGCEVWSIQKVSVGHPLTAQDLIASNAPPRIATELVAELSKLEAQQIAYLKPVTGPTC